MRISVSTFCPQWATLYDLAREASLPGKRLAAVPFRDYRIFGVLRRVRDSWASDAGCYLRNSVDPTKLAFFPPSTERARWSCPVDGGVVMLASKEISLTDAELDQVAGGVMILPILAGVAVGAVLGAVIVVGAVAAGDAIRHATGKGCILDVLK
jgi:hypothetical protein